MSKIISEVLDFDCGTPEEIFSVYMDSQKQSEISGCDVKIGKNAGDKFTALNGIIKGRNLYIIPGRMIVQSWRRLTWKRDVADAVLTIIFTETDKGTRVDLINANLPETGNLFVDRGLFFNLWKTYM